MYLHLFDKIEKISGKIVDSNSSFSIITEDNYAIISMLKSQIHGADFIIANTDVQALMK